MVELERRFRVVRKFREETEKGEKYGVRLSNTGGDNLTLLFESEEDLAPFRIQDDFIVKLVKPQKTLDDVSEPQ